MKIKEFFASADKAHWLAQIKKSDWGAGQYLHELLVKDALKALCGETTKLFLLTDSDRLVSFCTLAEKDDVRDTVLAPWIGFVYTFPEYRGHRYVGQLLEHAQAAANAKQVYISTNEVGLYEKYGFTFDQMLTDLHGEPTRVYRIEIK